MRKLIVLSFVLSLASAQDWPHYGNDPGGSRYSPLDQINRSNVGRLHTAWTYHTGDVSDGVKYPSRSAFEATPLVVDGVMYVTTPFSRLIALDPETGKELWAFDPHLNKDRSYNLFINRGAAYWSSGKEKRLFLGTLDGRLFAIDAATGRPAPGFGDNGWLDLRRGWADDFPGAGYGLTSPVVVYKNLVITGALVRDGEPQGPSGDIRALDARTGKLVWRFHVVPHKGEAGNETWEGESWKNRGGTNAWSMMSLDAERGMVFVPLTSPAYDYWGGDRKGQNLFSDAVVALDAATGKRLWHFQTIHHDLWDWDLPAQPNLVTVWRGGKQIPAVAQVTKTGFVFVLDRLTGKPLFDVEERPVPASKVPGEQSWPTQPFPVKPPPFARQTFAFDELTDVTPESRAECLKLAEGAVTGPMFRPIGLEWTVMFPSNNGGANWGGASFDPASGLLFVNAMDVGSIFRAVPRPEGSLIPYRLQSRSVGSSHFWDSKRLPCVKPPWGTLTAVDLSRGEFRWRSTLGVVDELVERGAPPTGAPNLGGSMVTGGGLVFIGATNDSRFRAFDKETGKELWVTRLPASGHATPMTFLGKKTGKQFVVIAAGGGNKYNSTYSDALVAFGLR
ncbi:MAG: pyrroloquinoline quinone-dependent dehydrogenase [Acidobacteria bacterium]|nr:pyrroloquinoline quinone-dependent dehydrogenase [Acidobacteriota bacterium]